MKHLYLLSLVVLVSACDVPSGNRRQIFNTPAGNAVKAPDQVCTTTNGVTTCVQGTPTPSSPTPTGGSTPTPTITSPTTGAGFESCSLASRGTTSTLGSVGACQSSSDETQVKFQTTLSDTSVRTCLIPTYKDSTGSSFPIGQPQCTLTEAAKIYQGKLYKDQSYPINGLMVMKENIMPGYYQCMNAQTYYTQNKCGSDPAYINCFNQYRYQYPNAAQMCCSNLAQQYQTSVCNSFKSQYGTQYLDIRLRY